MNVLGGQERNLDVSGKKFDCFKGVGCRGGRQGDREISHQDLTDCGLCVVYFSNTVCYFT